MILAIIYAFLTVFCVLGICDIIFFVKIYFVSPDKKPNEYILLLLDEENYRLQLCSAIQKKNWYGGMYCDYIIASTKNLKKATVYECIETFKNDDVFFIENINDIKYSGILGEG